MLQFTIADDLFNLRRQQLFALLLAHFDHLVAENPNVHLRLDFAVSTCAAVICDKSESFDQVLQRVFLLVAASYQRTQRVLVERSALLRVHISDHFLDFGLAWIEVEASDDRAQIASLDEPIGILVEQTENFTDLRYHDVRKNFTFITCAGAPRVHRHLKF